MKKVGINLLWMVPGVVGGSETYTTRLLHGLAERDSKMEYVLFALPQFASAHPDLTSQFETLYAPLTGQWKSFRVAGENSWLTTQSRKLKIDLLHHAGGVLPVFPSQRPVLTIHDLQYLYYPEYFTRTKLLYLKRMVPRSAENARLILTPSEFTRRTVIERLNIDPSIVVAVPHGISPREDKVDASDIRERFEISERFFLYPAATYPHKNHLVLLEAFARMLTLHPKVSLVLTGAKAWAEWKVAADMRDRIMEEINKLGIQNSVKMLGYVSSRDLDALYQEATAVTFASRFEGFGAPVLEAMARGCPVIASNATAIPEVVASAGRLVSPDNAEDWCNAMSHLLEDDDQRQMWAKLGIERAKDFAWTRSAEILEDSYSYALETTL
ncbi:MAG TPA: glycosyltransferase family 1 protein [Actinomycetota bacterium]|nr:glycosyltransferase family 1 protein [Actinomycetota bacterium]